MIFNGAHTWAMITRGRRENCLGVGFMLLMDHLTVMVAPCGTNVSDSLSF